MGQHHLNTRILSLECVDHILLGSHDILSHLAVLEIHR